MRHDIGDMIFMPEIYPNKFIVLYVLPSEQLQDLTYNVCEIFSPVHALRPGAEVWR